MGLVLGNRMGIVGGRQKSHLRLTPMFISENSFLVPENQVDVGVVVATPSGCIYSVVEGGDGSLFSINENTGVLTFNSAPNFETKSSYSITVRATTGSKSADQVISISVTNINEQPFNITLSSSSIDENLPANTAIGTLSTTDPDSNNTFSYSLVSGQGSTDNSSFNISGANLRNTDVFDFITKSSYSIRIRATDQGGLYFERVFAITVNYVYNEIPQYTAVYNAMTIKPSAVDRYLQNDWLKGQVNSGVYAKAISLPNFATHDQQSSLLNWKSPGTFNPSKQYNPTFTAYKGWKGVTGGGNINMNFVPATNGAGFLGQNDMTIAIGINDELEESLADFGFTGTNENSIYSRITGFSYMSLNSSQDTAELKSFSSKRYFGIVRNNASNVQKYKNLIGETVTKASTGLCASNLYACGCGSTTQNNKHESFILIAKALTEAEYQAWVETNERYLKFYGNNIRPYQTKVAFNLICEGHSFMAHGTALDDKLVGSIHTKKFYNAAIGGSTIADCVTRASTVDSKLITETATYKNILSLWIGVNDVYNVAGQGLIAYNALKLYVQARVVAGSKVFVFTMTPATGYPDRGAQFEIERGVFNTNVRNDLSLIPGVYILDTDTIPELNNPSNTTYYWNTLHPNNLGLRLAGQLFTDKIASLYS